MEYFTEKEQNLPVVDEYDVLVLGGGPAGVSAAVSASRLGAKVAIVERYGYLGGQATGGLVILLVGLTDGKERIIKGLCEETIRKLTELKSTKDIGNHVLFDPESLKYVFDSFILENRITPYYHSFVSGVIKENDRVTGAIIDGKSGRRVIKANMFVDATGDADLAKFADIPFGQENKENSLPVTLGFRVGGIDTEKVGTFISSNYELYQNMLRNLDITTRIGGWIPTLHNGEAWFNIANVENIDITDSDDLTRAEIIARMKIQAIMSTFKERIDGFENGYLIDTAAQMGVRESRKIKGLYQFTQEDVKEDFYDSIAQAPDYTSSGKGLVQVPYRCLVSSESENIIFAGRCISVEHKLIDMFREIPCCMATGQAAGISAAIALKTNQNLHTVDVRLIQENLISHGALIQPVLSNVYSCPPTALYKPI